MYSINLPIPFRRLTWPLCVAGEPFRYLREPKAAVIDKEGRYMYVNNFLPAQRADVDTVSACVSVIDLISGERVKDIQLYNGSNALARNRFKPGWQLCLCYA